MNLIDPRIQFTSEIETNNCFSFLDVLVIRCENDFQTTVFRKPFAVSVPRHRYSSRRPNQKLSAFNTFVFRATNICSTPQLLTAELNYLKAIAVDRGYSSNIIDSIYKKLTKPIDSEKHSNSNSNT